MLNKEYRTAEGWKERKAIILSFEILLFLVLLFDILFSLRQRIQRISMQTMWAVFHAFPRPPVGCVSEA